MKVALIGATGRVGSRLASELLARGHAVTGIVRHASPGAPVGTTLVQADATDAHSLAARIAAHDAVVSAARFATSDADAVIAAMKSAGVARLLVVGGAGSLEVAPGKRLMDTPDFPKAFAVEAEAGARFLERLKSEHDLDWTYLSPAADLAPGQRTGHFRLGDDRLLTDANGESHVSMEDFAIALVDELEHPKHNRRRFTVGY